MEISHSASGRNSADALNDDNRNDLEGPDSGGSIGSSSSVRGVESDGLLVSISIGSSSTMVSEHQLRILQTILQYASPEDVIALAVNGGKATICIPEVPIEASKRFNQIKNQPKDFYDKPQGSGLTKPGFFCGRERLLDELFEHYRVDNPCPKAIFLLGLGGIGKTQLALEFVWRAHERRMYSLIVWLRGKRDALEEDMRGLVAWLGYGYDVQRPPGLDTVAKTVYERLAYLPRVLFVVDGAEKEDEAFLASVLPKAGLLSELKRKSNRFDWLVTTRYFHSGWNQYFQGQVERKWIQPFEPEETLRYCQARLNSSALIADVESIQGLGKMVGHLPLALMQAVAYINRHPGMTLARYFEHFSARGAQLCHPTEFHTGPTVLQTWFPSLCVLWDESPRAVLLLLSCAYMAEKPIPMDVLSVLYQEVCEALLNPSFPKKTSGKLTSAVTFCAEQIKNHSLGSWSPIEKQLTLPPLLQRVLRWWLEGVIDILDVCSASDRTEMNALYERLTSKRIEKKEVWLPLLSAILEDSRLGQDQHALKYAHYVRAHEHWQSQAAALPSDVKHQLDALNDSISSSSCSSQSSCCP